MRTVFPLSLSILIHICILKLALTQEPTSQPTSHTLVTRLIHYLAIDSPFFDPNKSTWDLTHSDLERSISRAFHLTANPNSSFHVTDIESQLAATGSGFLAHLQVGSKSLEQLVYMDTGSSLLWINCVPCVLTAPEPLFDPKDSTSFAIENCKDSGICDGTGAVRVECSNNGRCTYKIQYAVGESRGYLAREIFKFGSSEEILEKITFGCSRVTDLRVNGILGLGSNHLSLTAQRNSSRFSYCLGNISDKSYSYHTIAIGDQIELVGDKTPLIIEDKYYITLEGINFGDKVLDIDLKIFKRNSADYTGGMVVDTGSTYTFIPHVALEKFEDAIFDLFGLIDFRLPQNTSITYRGGWYTMLCYDGILTKDLRWWFPTVKFKFQGGAIMEV